MISIIIVIRIGNRPVSYALECFIINVCILWQHIYIGQHLNYGTFSAVMLLKVTNTKLFIQYFFL